MFPKFTPKSPDPFMQNGMDAADAKFGHLNAVVDYINADQGVISDGVTIIGTGTEEDPLIAIGGEGGAGVKTAIAFSTDHLSSTGNEYVVGNVVWYNGNIYRCIANNDSLIPTSTEYWSNLGAGFQAIESPVDWNSTSGNNQILNKPTNFGSPSLQDVTDTGNTTTNDISFGVGAKILMSNGTKLQEGTSDAGLGGNKGIALRCSIDYELKWEAGRLFVMHQDGFIIREVRYTGVSEPTTSDDYTKGFVVGSRWVLDNGDTYVCNSVDLNLADWEILFSADQCIPLVGTTKGGVTGNVSVKTDEGGRITIVYPNEDAIILGTESSIYSAISFYDATVNETVNLYIRGGDLFLLNEDTDEQVGGLITTINTINNTRVNFSPNFNTLGQDAWGTGNYLYLGENGKQYLDNGVATRQGFTKLPSHYFIDSCSYTQIGTSAPTVLTTFETQVGDFSFAGVVSKSIDYITVGQYRISYQESFGLGYDPYLPTDLNKVKVIISPGKVPLTILSYDVNFTAVGRLSVDIFVRQSTTGNLVNSFLAGSVVDVYFYR